METYLTTNASTRVVETDFLANTNHKLFFRLVETYFLMNPSFQLLEKDFLFIGNRLLQSSFLLAETVPNISGNQADLILADGNHFLPFSQIFFKEFFIPASGNTFFSPEEKLMFFTFFSCLSKPLKPV